MSAYIVLLLIFYINHFLAVAAFTDIAATIGLMKIDAVGRERFVTITTFL
jgi:ABC-type polysaccharide transport system permease subunit